MRRLLAFVVAIAMVAGALALRAGFDDEGDGDGPDGRDSSGTIQLACAPELEAACQALDEERDDVAVIVEEAGTTADALVAGPADVDGWLVPAPWPGIVNAEAARDLLGEPSGPLARSPLVIVMWEGRRAALAAGDCGGEVQWRCLGVAAGQPWSAVGGDPGWGPVRVGHRPPDTSATGLLVLGHAATGYFDRPDFAANDFDLDQDFRGWLSGLEGSGGGEDDPLGRLLTLGPSAFGAVGTTEAEATGRIEGTRFEADLTVLYPSPMATADVVLAPVVASSRADRVVELAEDDTLLAALADARWQPPDAVEPAPAEGNGLPSAGVLLALQRRAAEVR